MVSLPKTVPIVEYGLLNLFKDKGFDLNIERDNKSVYDPSKIFEALDRYHKPIEFNFKPDILKKAKDITFKHFAKPRDFDHLTPLHLGDDLIKIIHEEKSSGLPFMSRKGEVLIVILHFRKRSLLVDVPLRLVSLFTVSNMEKVVQRHVWCGVILSL